MSPPVEAPRARARPSPAAGSTPDFTLADHLRVVRRLVRNRRLARIRGSVLGRWWALLLPLAESGVFTLVVGLLLLQRGGALEYLLFVFPGLWAWRVFARGVQAAGSSLRSHRSLLHAFPVPASATVHGAVGGVYRDGVVALPVVALVVLGGGWSAGALPSPMETLWLLPALALHVLATVGLGALVAVAGAFWADVRRALGPALAAAMFLAPVVYPADVVPAGLLRTAFLANPVAAALECLRAGLGVGAPPPLPALLGAGALGLGLAGAGAWALRAADPRVREVL